MDYWSSLFTNDAGIGLRIYGPRWSWGPQLAKKIETNIQPSWPSKPGIKGRIGNFFLRDTAGSPERAGKIAPSCPLGVANHSAEFGSSCPFTELATLLSRPGWKSRNNTKMVEHKVALFASIPHSLRRRANARNVSFITRYGGQFTFST